MRGISISALVTMIATFGILLCSPTESEQHSLDHDLYEENLLLEHLTNRGLLHKMHAAQSLRVYIGKKHADISQYEDTKAVSEDGLYPGPLLNLSRCELSPDLYPVKDWLHVHMEYTADSYVYLRFKNNFTVVASAEEADLCLGHCDDGNTRVPGRRNQFPVFVVPRGKENSIFYCDIMNFGIEDYGLDVSSHCHLTAPYVTSIYPPNASAVAPWNLPLVRSNLLVFFGSVWRGRRRQESVHEMEIYSKIHQNDVPEHFSNYFLAPVKIASHDEENFVDSFFADAWNSYAHSFFSWQPAGDSPTRRAFYDSWLFGCIPVITTKSAEIYKLLFKERLFTGDTFVFEDIVVVLPHDVFTNGTLILEHLANMPVEEIRQRQSKLRSIAPLIQWGWKTRHHIDALLLVFATLMK